MAYNMYVYVLFWP